MPSSHGCFGSAPPSQVFGRSESAKSPRLHWIPHKPAAALPFGEIRRQLGAAFRARYRGGRWFESTAAHTNSATFHNANRSRRRERTLREGP